MIVCLLGICGMRNPNESNSSLFELIHIKKDDRIKLRLGDVGLTRVLGNAGVSRKENRVRQRVAR
jgi:hypothetical protein